jgi:hypothetical protein
MENPYKVFLDSYFDKLLGFRHSTSRVNKVLTRDVEAYLPDGARFYSGSALVISDWTGPTDNGWEINFHTGIFKETLKEFYPIEIKKIISRECCLMFAQSFEALESFLKDLVFYKVSSSAEFEQFVLIKTKKNGQTLTRDKMPSGDNLFDCIKKLGGDTYKTSSIQNNLNFRFKELWTILSITRHAITHSQSVVKKSEIECSDYHFAVFEKLFDFENKDDKLEIQLDFKKFERLIKKLSEFGFQVFKFASIEDNFEWRVDK